MSSSWTQCGHPHKTFPAGSAIRSSPGALQAAPRRTPRPAARASARRRPPPRAARRRPRNAARSHARGRSGGASQRRSAKCSGWIGSRRSPGFRDVPTTPKLSCPIRTPVRGLKGFSPVLESQCHWPSIEEAKAKHAVGLACLKTAVARARPAFDDPSIYRRAASGQHVGQEQRDRPSAPRPTDRPEHVWTRASSDTRARRAPRGPRSGSGTGGRMSYGR